MSPMSACLIYDKDDSAGQWGKNGHFNTADLVNWIEVLGKIFDIYLTPLTQSQFKMD